MRKIFGLFAASLCKQSRITWSARMASSKPASSKPEQSFKVCANLSFMFQEHSDPLVRYKEAVRLGFRGVETANPYNVPALEIEKALDGVQQVLINTPTGDLEEGEIGFASLPGKEGAFLVGLQNAINYATTLNCKLIHIMAGLVLREPIASHHQVYIENMRKAAKKLEEANIVGVIEPINPYSVPYYYLNDYDRAVFVIEEVGSSNLGLLLDIFHLQQLTGNVTRNIKKYLKYTKHIQVAQVPDRHEPDSPGELNYEYIFSLLNEEKYTGWVGLEYKPAFTTEEGLAWLEKLGVHL